MIKGYAGRVLEIDLTERSFSFEPLDEEIARLYIGGKGYGTRLLYDRTAAGIDCIYCGCRKVRKGICALRGCGPRQWRN